MPATRTPKTSAPVIQITATPKKRLPVDLVGVTYEIKPPKTALLLSISSHTDKAGKNDGAGVNEDFQRILKLMFLPEDVEAIQERLKSEDDELDMDHIFETIEALTEASGGNPTS